MIKTRAPFALLTCLPLAFAAGCESPPTKPPAALVTMATLAAMPETAGFGAGLDRLFSGGFERNYFLAKGRIRVATAFTERASSAYITTDLWANFPGVWIQPVYILKSSDPNEKAQWVFSVDENSRFYSPFWQIFNVTVPPGSANRYTSVRAILNAGFPITPGRGTLSALVPDGVSPEAVEAPDADPFAHAFLATQPGLTNTDAILKGSYRPHVDNGWVDGRLRQFIDFGVDRFEWTDDGEIVEAPLFFFFTQQNGAWVPITDLPRVGGTGPLFARRPPVAPNNRPVFGSFWRLWAARVPSTARVFVPAALQASWDAHVMRDHHPELPEVDLPASADTSDAALQAAITRHAFSVMASDGCLNPKQETDDAGAPVPPPPITAAVLDGCPWLDSQAALETHLTRDNLVPSEILVSCPYLAFDNKPVPFAVPQ
jgi:hypothetical protein